MRDFSDSPLAFTPVPVRPRRDGWTAERQVSFVALVRSGCSILEACRRVGLSSESFYRLSRRPDAESFRRAGRAALAARRADRFARATAQVPLSPPTPSTAARPPAETNGTCRIRQDHQLPDGAPAKTPRSVPAYSLEGFKRAVRAGRRPSARPKSSTSGPIGSEWHV